LDVTAEAAPILAGGYKELDEFHRFVTDSTVMWHEKIRMDCNNI